MSRKNWRGGGRLLFEVGIIDGRGGVEETRLEAKDTKKIRGQSQGQPYRGQTLSRPRTGMLDAKDQGHKLKCFPKKNNKKDLQKKFSGTFKEKGLKKIFLGHLQKKPFSKKFFRRSKNFKQLKK